MKHIGLISETLTGSAIGAFYAVYDELGSGFLEHIYVAALQCELCRRGHDVARETSVPVFFRGERIGLQRLDMVVDQQVVVEVKAAESALDYGSKQLFSYLRATRLEVGLLFSFGAKPIFKRVVCRNALKADKAGHDRTGGYG